MDTSTAAQIAKVSASTIRRWCRSGRLNAIKVDRRWVINTTSLYVAAGVPQPIRYTIGTMTAIGGHRWQHAGHDRVYLNNWATFAGLHTSRYGTGNISAATWQGTEISNSQAYKLLGSINKIYFDAADGKLHCQFGYTTSRVASPNEVWQAVVEGVCAAITAL